MFVSLKGLHCLDLGVRAIEKSGRLLGGKDRKYGAPEKVRNYSDFWTYHLQRNHSNPQVSIGSQQNGNPCA
jgi:hypothetical protein